MRKTIFSLLATVSLSLLVVVLFGCVDSATSSSQGEWSYSGAVIDGYTEQPLAGVTITYYNEKGEMVSVVTGVDGNFYIDPLPYGERNFTFTSPAVQTALGPISYTQKRVTAGSFNESNQIEGVIGDLSQIIELYPMAATLTGKLSAQIAGSDKLLSVANTIVKLTYGDTSLVNSTPVSFETVSDAAGSFTFTNALLADNPSLYIEQVTVSGAVYGGDNISIDQIFSGGKLEVGTIYLSLVDSAQTFNSLVSSNVLTADGFGLTNVPVNVQPYFVLAATPNPQSVDVTIKGGGEPDFKTVVSGDTVFIYPVKNFAFDSEVAVNISAVDLEGNRMVLALDEGRAFHTASPVFAIESNMWESGAGAKMKFGLYDTMWVRFSELLDADVNKIEWLEPETEYAIYGSGVNTNAAVWVSADTLFVSPDQRLEIDYDEVMGFKTIMTSATGNKSDSLEFNADIVEDNYYVVWTNTKNAMGGIRDDFGVKEPVKVVSSVPVQAVTRISGMTGYKTPPDLSLDNIQISGDTISYTSSLYMNTDTTYGITFDVLFTDGTVRTEALGVRWRTASKVRITSTNNRLNGIYRPFTVIGDSLVVTFSSPIDTSATAAVPFRVNMTSVTNEAINTVVTWDAQLVTATIRNTDTLPAADVDAMGPYTDAGINTKAIKSLSFNLTTLDGESLYGYNPGDQSLEIHTEKGLAAIDANFITGHHFGDDISVTESVTDKFSVDGTLSVTFNRELDTVAIHAAQLTETVVKLADRATKTAVDVTLSFSVDAKTLYVKPVSVLESATEYDLSLNKVAALNIAGAPAINKHGGKFTGREVGGNLLNKPFRTQ